MAIILLCFAFGIGLGVWLRKRKKLAGSLQLLTDGVVCILLFLLGASIGNNPAIVSNLASLGWVALVLAFGATLGSMLAVYPLYHFLFRKNDP